MIDRIYIKIIEGTQAWVLINAQQIQDDNFEILADSEFDDLDSSRLFEFYPGDIVKLGHQTFSNGTHGRVAKNLILLSTGPDRKYWEFMFLAVIDRIAINLDTSEKYNKEIERIKKEHKLGQFFYPVVLTIIDKLDNLKRQE